MPAARDRSSQPFKRRVFRCAYRAPREGSGKVGGLTSRKEQDHVERPFLFRYSAVPLSVSLRRFKSFLRFARSFHLFIGRAQASQTWNAFASASHSRYCYFFSCVSCTWWQPANSAAPGRVRGAWIFQFICTAPVCNSLWSRDAWCRSSNVDEDVYGRKKNHCCCIVRSLSFVVFYTLLRVYCHHYFLLPRVSVNLN